MLIELLFLPGCPNHQPAVGRVKKALEFEALDTPIQEIVIEDEYTARTLQFPGSPTVRINGQDVEPQSGPRFGIACRMYSGGGGLPTEESLRRAISAAKKREETNERSQI